LVTAALATRLRPHFLDCLPKAERTAGDRELGRPASPAPLQVEQQLFPGLRTLAHTVDQADQLLLVLGVAPMMKRRHCAASSSLAWTWMPSAQK
jgi:hypothetical protein